MHSLRVLFISFANDASKLAKPESFEVKVCNFEAISSLH